MSSEHGCERSRTLIVHKDEAGYGLTLCGDKPTRVQSVKSGGASDRAGVREGDLLIKVNGQQVTDSNHGDVVQLLRQHGSYVELTVVHSSRLESIGGSMADVFSTLLQEVDGAEDSSPPAKMNEENEMKKVLTYRVYIYQ